MVNDTYGMLPYACTRGDESSSRVPVNVSDTIVISRIHQLQIGSQIFVTLRLLALEVHIKEFHIEALL